jgi:hypothetical protein
VGEAIKKKTFALQEDHLDGCCGPPASLVGGCLPWPPCPALPCPICHHRQKDRETPLLLLYIGWLRTLLGKWQQPLDNINDGGGWLNDVPQKKLKIEKILEGHIYN